MTLTLREAGHEDGVDDEET